MKPKKRGVLLVMGWTFFIGSSTFMLYKLLRGLFSSLEFKTLYYLPSFTLKEWAIPLILFFVGIYLLYKYQQKSSFLSAITE